MNSKISYCLCLDTSKISSNSVEENKKDRPHGLNTNHVTHCFFTWLFPFSEASKFLQYEIDNGLIYSKLYHRNPYAALSLEFCVDW